jgi:hypothetical protein
MRHIVLSALLCLALSGVARADVIALWNFNDADLFVDRGGGSMTSDFNPSHIADIGGSSINSQDGDPAGQALRLSSSANNGRNLTWMVSTEGFDTIDVSFAASRTSTGFSDNQFLYSIDSGISWIDFGNYSPGTSFALQGFNLGGILDLNNNPGAGFRIVFGGATSSAGNNRIDNLVVSGNTIIPIDPDPAPVPEPSTIALMSAGIGCLFFGHRFHRLRRL